MGAKNSNLALCAPPARKKTRNYSHNLNPAYWTPYWRESDGP